MVSPGPERDVFMNNGPVYFRSNASCFGKQERPLGGLCELSRMAWDRPGQAVGLVRVRSEAIRELPEMVELTFTCQ